MCPAQKPGKELAGSGHRKLRALAGFAMKARRDPVTPLRVRGLVAQVSDAHTSPIFTVDAPGSPTPRTEAGRRWPPPGCLEGGVALARPKFTFSSITCLSEEGHSPPWAPPGGSWRCVAWPDMSPGPPGPSLSLGLLYSRGDPEYRRAHTYMMLLGWGRTGLHPTLGWGTGATLQHTLVHLWGLERSVSLCLLPKSTK